MSEDPQESMVFEFLGLTLDAINVGRSRRREARPNNPVAWENRAQLNQKVRVAVLWGHKHKYENNSTWWQNFAPLLPFLSARLPGSQIQRYSNHLRPLCDDHGH